MKEGHFIVRIGYAPAPAIGEPNPTEPDGKAKLFIKTQGPQADDTAKVLADVRTEFAKAKPGQFIVDISAHPVDKATYETQRIMNLTQGKKSL